MLTPASARITILQHFITLHHKSPTNLHTPPHITTHHHAPPYTSHHHSLHHHTSHFTHHTQNTRSTHITRPASPVPPSRTQFVPINIDTCSISLLHADLASQFCFCVTRDDLCTWMKENVVFMIGQCCHTDRFSFW